MPRDAAHKVSPQNKITMPGDTASCTSRGIKKKLPLVGKDAKIYFKKQHN